MACDRRFRTHRAQFREPWPIWRIGSGAIAWLAVLLRPAHDAVAAPRQPRPLAHPQSGCRPDSDVDDDYCIQPTQSRRGTFIPPTAA
jgi:hypothetical protein